MADDHRIYCPLIPGLCEEAYDCEDCSVFADTTASLGLKPLWACSVCLPPGHHPSGKTMLGHYQEGPCDVCEEISVVLQAVVDEGEMSREKWRSVLKEIRIASFGEE